MLITGKFVGERSHVTRALNIILSTQWVDANTFTAEVASCHRQVCNTHDHGRALAVLGDTKAIVDSAVFCAGKCACSLSDLVCSDASDGFNSFRSVSFFADEVTPLGIGLQITA